MSEDIELKVKVDRKMFYNSESSWGVFALKPVTNKDLVKLNDYNNFVVNGNMPELFVDKEYDIKIRPSTHPKYGDGYSIVHVTYQKPTSISEQQEYIRIMLTEKQSSAILEKYPNHLILDMMKDGTFDYNGVKNIGEKNYKKIKGYLLDNLDIQESLVELKDLNITFASMKKLVEHFGTPEVVVKRVQANIYSLCEVKGFGFLKVDAYALNRGDDKENPNRIIAAINFVLASEESNGNTWISRSALHNKLIELLQVGEDVVNSVVNGLANNKQFYLDENRVALYKNYFYEREIKKRLYRLHNAKSKLHIKDVEKKIAEAEKLAGIIYSDEQREAIQMAVENNVFILNGKGGVGKTSVLKAILSVHNNYKHACCALSGKASKIMSSLGLNAFTIHRLLGFDPKLGFKHNEKEKLPYHVVVIDEASMSNVYLMYSIICAIEEGMKLIIVGDGGQLEAIGAGAVFSDLLKSEVFPQKELTQVHRQAAKSGILSSANEIREGRQIVDTSTLGKQVYGELKDFVLFPLADKQAIKELTLDVCRTFLNKNIDDFQVITALKARGDISVKTLNNEIQAIFNDLNKPSVKRGAYEYREGDRVIQSGNNYEAGENFDISVFNGTIGKIVDLEKARNDKEKDKLYIKFEGIDEVICYMKEQIDQIELAYAITCHRSQGSTIPYTLFVFDYSAYTLLNRQFVYTGLTRASKGCVVVCEGRALRHAVRTDSAGRRNTFLLDMLMEEEVDLSVR
ncbi:AAA family ATPase [Cytobacillus gottheilii]|uniref:AAA family ATPase n=1 Tax=Cytobacillus gottheilii TaxID=859144 RepID=UPI0009B95456|nr:AAA family ATPase [Cytobacillus gottheilii]